jgi:type IV pilus assembly protein PilP
MTIVRSTFTIARALVLVTLASGTLSACSSDLDELQAQIEQERKQPGGPVESLPEIKPYETYAYDASTIRSPFVPGAPAAAANAGLRPDQRRNREFLEQFSLDTLKMVGTLDLGGHNYGLVQTQDGLVHRVLTGNYVGQNDGRILSVTSAKINLIEIVPDGVGGYIERPAALGLTD